ncbi:MAG: hypothetical protein ACOX52_17040 [Verrucomicrobiota bacterium]
MSGAQRARCQPEQGSLVFLDFLDFFDFFDPDSDPDPDPDFDFDFDFDSDTDRTDRQPLPGGDACCSAPCRTGSRNG